MALTKWPTTDGGNWTYMAKIPVLYYAYPSNYLYLFRFQAIWKISPQLDAKIIIKLVSSSIPFFYFYVILCDKAFLRTRQFGNRLE